MSGRWTRIVAVALAAVLALHLAARPPRRAVALEATVTARVVHVTDGDTVKVQGPGLPVERVRLLGIDAPEMDQDFGKVARRVLADKVEGREVLLHTHGRDRYGRVLAELVLDGVDVNLAMVREGLAWHYAHYAADQFPGDAARYARAQADARALRTGLWAYPNPVPPWDWRRRKR